MDLPRHLESGEKHRLNVEGLPYDIELPMVTLPSADGNLRIASLNLIGQVKLNADLGRLMAEQIKREIPDYKDTVILTVVEKALMVVQEAARHLEMDAVAVAYNRIKPHMEAMRRPVIKAGTGSITSGDKYLAIYERDLNILNGAKKGFILIDDVVSTGGTILGLAAILEAAMEHHDRPAPEVRGIFCVAREGDKHPFLPAPVHGLATLPKPVLEQD